MPAYWVSFENCKSGCIEADTKEAARTIGAGFGVVSNVKPLPYPAEPRLHKMPYNDKGDCIPAFCFSPRECAGYTSCRRRYACSE